MKITNEVLEGYLNCKTKGHLKLAGDSGIRSDYEAMTEEARQASREQAVVKLIARFGEGDACRNVLVTVETLKKGAPLLADAALEEEGLSLRFDALNRTDGASKLGDHHYLPVLHNHGDKVGRSRKLLLAVLGLVLARVQGLRPSVGLIARGSEGRLGKVRLDAKLYRQAEQVLDDVKRLQAGGEPPRLTLNKHCQVCEFRQRCHAQAVKDDDISLLGGVGEKELKKYNRKGIFTLTQLSCTFRPRKKGKRTVQRTKRHHALQAMAIRDKRIYVFGTPTLPGSPVKIYFDIEGLPDEGFVYLIGLVVCKDGQEKRLSFWADSKDQEADIFRQFLDEVTSHDDFQVFCYGSYERAFLERMRKTESWKGQVEQVLKALVNVLSVVYGHLYFPCYSNGLKDVAGCLGYSWADPDASGLQSIVWRKRWEADHADEWKDRLTRYNVDDYDALKTVADFIGRLGERDSQKGGQPCGNEGGFPVGRAEEQQVSSGRPDWHDQTAALPDFDHIRKCGHFDYQREKVYYRTNKTIRKACVRQAKGRAKKFRPNRTIVLQQETCPRCNSSDIRRLTGKMHVKEAYDLRFSPGGIHRVVVHCMAATHRCRECKKEFHPERYKRRDKHLHGLKSWAMYQHVAQRISLGNVQDMFAEFFGLRVVGEELHMIKSLMAKRYQPTWETILHNILSGDVLHVDETPIHLRQGTGYVWVLANLEEVVYLYQPTREGDFLHDLLKPFSGVLVSDFFSAYDSLPCKQQKCLIHLTRDFNADILKNPYDDELKSLGSDFGRLLREIISTVDRYGLKKRHLGKHGDDVRRFFRTVASQRYSSELAEGYQTRLLKNEGRLFTFLEHDGVPWNNNNAECAIKRFACYRRISDGQILEAGLKDYLVLLSVFQTCRYKGVSFLQFLLSGNLDVDQYRQGGRKRPAPLTLELYPDGYPPQTRRNRRKRDTGTETQHP